MGKTYKYDKDGDKSFEEFRRFKKEHVKKETEDEQEWQETENERDE
jgi:hypothetical protein